MSFGFSVSALIQALRISRTSNHVRSDNKYAEDGWARGRAGRASLATRNRNTKTIITRETVAHQTVAIMEAAQEMLTSRVLSNMYEGNSKSRRQVVKRKRNARRFGEETPVIFESRLD